MYTRPPSLLYRLLLDFLTGADKSGRQNAQNECNRNWWTNKLFCSWASTFIYFTPFAIQLRSNYKEYLGFWCCRTRYWCFTSVLHFFILMFYWFKLIHVYWSYTRLEEHKNVLEHRRKRYNDDLPADLNSFTINPPKLPLKKCIC